MLSRRFIGLQQAIAELRRLLLPCRFEPTGLYKRQARVRARAASFRVLAHAELESYFEDRVEEIAKSTLGAWKQQRHVSRVTLHLLAFSGRQMTLPPATLEAPQNKKQKTWEEQINIADRLERSVSDYIRRITKENHGIRERNIMSMLLPIGFPPGQCDSLLLMTLNSFGEDRGLIAHSSGAYVTQSIDPKGEFERLKGIIEELRPVDGVLDTLLAEAKPTVSSGP